MSFTGHGPLNAFGWGTTTEGALAQQETRILESFAHVNALLNSEGEPVVHPDDESIFLAGIFHTNELDWDQDRKQRFHAQRKKHEYLPKHMAKEIHEWREAQWAALKQRQTRIDAMEPQDKCILVAIAKVLGAVVVNVHLREILLYPLVRDHLPDGEALFASAIQQSSALKVVIKALRESLCDCDFSGKEWVSSFREVERHWVASWEFEKQSIVPQLAEFLRAFHLPDLTNECSGDPNHPVPTPSPPPNHNFNYGQQLVQMFEILYKYYTRSGYFQGIPRTRHEPDWTPPDGFGILETIACGHLDKFSASHQVVIPPMELPAPSDSDLPKAKDEIPHPKFDAYVPFGASASVLERKSDAPSEEVRKELESLHEYKKNLTVKAIERAHQATYGSNLIETLADIPHMARRSLDVAKSMIQLASSSFHTEDTDGSFMKSEVNLALRNHGTHFEALGQDITPLGNHYLLIHFDVQQLDPKEYTLKVFGCVEKPSVWTLQDIQNLCPEAVVRQPLTMECSGNGRTRMKPRFNHHVPWEFQAFGTYIWGGIPLRLLLQAVGVTDKAVDIVFTGNDAGIQEQSLRHYQRAVDINDPIVDFMLVIWENNGMPLLKEHGFPLRILTPGWYGDNNVKWLRSIELVDHKFKGRHMLSYSYTAQHWDMDLSVPSQEMRPRAMVLPPGYPEFMERSRIIVSGTHTFVGKAWVGGGFYRSVTVVEVSIDNAKTWKRARLGPRFGMFAWHTFSIELDLAVGVYDVFIRATDSAGQQQKAFLSTDDWNWHGMCDDACQAFKLIVVDQLAFTI